MSPKNNGGRGQLTLDDYIRNEELLMENMANAL